VSTCNCMPTPSKITPLPPEVFPVTVEGTGLSVAPIAALRDAHCDLEIDWTAYGRTATASVGSMASILPWEQRMVVARQPLRLRELSTLQQNLLGALADSADFSDLPRLLGVTRRQVDRGLAAGHQRLRVANHSASATTALILSGGRPPIADRPPEPLAQEGVQLLALYAAGETHAVLAQRFDSSVAAVYRQMAKLCLALGLKPIRQFHAAQAKMFSLGLFIAGRPRQTSNDY
jgi:hypothetical protein